MTRFTRRASAVTFLVFVAALLPRLYALGAFLTIDEVKWAEGAAQFLLGLHSGNLAQTYWHFHPGITVTWGSALALGAMCLPEPDLAMCTHTRLANLAGAIGWLRLSPVLLTSLGVAGVYALGRKLLAGKTALLAALLLAFDPFFLAHSRLLNGDAGTAILMFLSLLAFLIYWLRAAEPNRRAAYPYLLLSGVMAGLAWLTKLPAPLIGPFIAGLSLAATILTWRRQGWPTVRQWLVALAGWGGIALLVFFIFWPALWVAPLKTLRQMYLDTFEVGEAGEGHDTFYQGQTLDDPGPWFYPYAIAFRLTPVVCLGLLILPARLILPFKSKSPAETAYGLPETISPSQRHDQTTEFITVLVLLAFAVFTIVLANASPKKLDRYVMAVIPALIFLSATGIAQIMNRGSDGERQRSHLAAIPALIPAGLVAIQLLSAIFAAPYYLTYYNPLLGGVQRAVTQVPVGWGEGLEQAAQYLNQLPGAESLVASSWYGDIFEPYFVGQQGSFADDGRAQLAADYVVFYINQVQRRKPYPGLVNYFRATEPVFTLNIGPLGNLSTEAGVPWVEVYQAPAAQSAGGAPKIEGVAQLLAYKVAGSRIAGEKGSGSAVPPISADDLSITLYLKVLGPLPPGSALDLTLSPITNPRSPLTGAQWRWLELKGRWQAGAVVEWPGLLTLPAATPPGDYRLSIALRDNNASVMAEFALSDKDPAITLQ